MIWWVAGVFAAGLLAALAATPLAARFGRAFGFMDAPQGRKIHTHPIPRCGGLALVAAFFAAVAVAGLASFPQAGRQIETSHVLAVFAGGLFIFLVGLADDRKPLPAKVKLLAQIAAAAICFFSGVKIESFTLGSAINIDLDFLSFVLTAFWFVLFINAINLIDGLDGLAAGVSFFVCAVQAVLASMRAEPLPAMYFAALAGASLGFLRYNFNPASIFLGDGGSYFLGYMVAALSILTSAKSQVGATILMPILAFGVPLLDTITAPLRRFVRGKKMFEPDREHVHHKLIAKGWSQRRTVVFLYGVTAFLALMAVLIVNMRDVPAGLFILLLGGALILFVRTAGWFSFFALDKVAGWIRDISDEAGVSRGRRTFLNLQIEISQAPDVESLWANVSEALDQLGFDLGEMTLAAGMEFAHAAAEADAGAFAAQACRLDGESLAGAGAPSGPACFEWTRAGLERDRREYLSQRSLLKVELPLMDQAGRHMGTLWLVKNIADSPLSDFTLRRAEQLRRTMVSTLERLKDVA
jgi:UDP-GlcNAc:undecaprenyl-phosphate GlcNAc-1-phosphate transferase